VPNVGCTTVIGHILQFFPRYPSNSTTVERHHFNAVASSVLCKIGKYTLKVLEFFGIFFFEVTFYAVSSTPCYLITHELAATFGYWFEFYRAIVRRV
jgi:hypothetical protein